MKDSTLIKCFSMAGITIVSVTALLLGYDSVLLSLVLSAIAGLGGYSLGTYKGLAMKGKKKRK